MTAPARVTDEQALAVLACPMEDNDSGADTVRGYLITLLTRMWEREGDFSGKKPFGNGGWQYDLYLPLIRAGIVPGTLDENGYVEHFSRDAEAQADALIGHAIMLLGRPPAAAPAAGPVTHCMGCKGWTSDWEYECEGLPAAWLSAEGRAFAIARTGWELAGEHLYHRELRSSGWGSEVHGPYWQEWFCEPPLPATAFRVAREEWAPPAEDGYPVRRIYAIEVRDAAQEQAEEGRPGS